MQLQLELRNIALVLLVQLMEILHFVGPYSKNTNHAIRNKLCVMIDWLFAAESWFSKKVINLRIISEDI